MLSVFTNWPMIQDLLQVRWGPQGEPLGNAAVR